MVQKRHCPRYPVVGVGAEEALPKVMGVGAEEALPKVVGVGAD